MNKIIYHVFNEAEGKFIGSVTAEGYLSFPKVLSLLGAKWQKIDSPDDPDVILDGKEYDSNKISMRTFQQISPK